MRHSWIGGLGLVLLLGLQGCSGNGERDTPPVATPAPVEATTLSDCAAVLPATVAQELGWSEGTAVPDEFSGCTLAVPEGTITVQRRPVAATRPGDVGAAVKRAYDGRCAELDQGDPGLAVDWLGPEVPACAVAAPDGSGVSVLVARPATDLVVEVRVSPVVPTTAAQVQRALVDLEQAAAAHL
jgi:hypothetical protein